MQTNLLQTVIQANTVQHQAPARATAPSTVTTSSKYYSQLVFPSWKGVATSKAIFLKQIPIFRDHDFFLQVKDWSDTTPSTTTQSTHI